MGGEVMNYKDLFDQSGQIRLLIRREADELFYIMDANRKAIAYLGVDAAADLRDKPIEDVLDVINMSQILQALTICFDSHVLISTQLVPQNKDYVQIQPCILNPVKNSGGQVEWVELASALPTTEQDTAERERDDAISMFTTLFDESDVGFTVLDHNGRFVRTNDAFLAMTGWDRLELIGNKLDVIIPMEDRELAWQRHDKVINEGQKSLGEVRLIRKDGSDLYVIATSTVLELSNNRKFRITTNADVTELRRAKQLADEANKAKSAFLANMSHELRTPLNAIIGFSDMMINATLGPIENKQYVEYLGDIQFSAAHLLQIINDVLDMSKIEAGKMPFNEEDIHLAGLLETLVRLMKTRADQNNIHVDVKAQDNLVRLRADERLVRQVLLNLLSNAVKFSKPHSDVIVKADVRDDGLVVQVIDQGIGIPADRLKDIMEPFGQVADPRINNGQGTGLGLPIAKAMMELHGGSLHVESDLDKGTTVTCLFPPERVSFAKA